MLAKNAKQLADILMGLEDTRKELIEAYIKSQEADVVPPELVDAAQRWYDLTGELENWYDVVDGVANSGGSSGSGGDDSNSG